MGFAAGFMPDRPPSIPPPLPVALAADVVHAQLDAFVRGLAGRPAIGAAVVIGGPLAFAEVRLLEGGGRRRAIRMGLRRVTDAPPGGIVPGRLALSLAMTYVRRGDARRRAAWPHSAATLVGVRWAITLERERLWRAELREWRARAGAAPALTTTSHSRPDDADAI